MDLVELLTVETSVLRTLCLTVNSESSELKTRINENLAEASFYFPITKSIFAAVSALASEGTNVDPTSLGQALTQRSVDVPDDFFLEDLFAGEAPSTQELAEWMGMMGSDNGSETSAVSDHALPPNANPNLAKTHPSIQSSTRMDEAAEPPPQDDASAIAREEAEKPVPPPKRASRPAPNAEVPSPAVEKAEERERVTSKPATRNEDQVLTPESGAWLGYLAELTKKQGEHLKTGFAGFDAEWGGLGPGLLLLAGKDRSRLLDFLKQLVDQIAIRCRVPCLYLSFERSKFELRLQTLSRLSESPASNIRDGRYDKDSAEWQSIIRAGEHAVEWLQRIYVVEPSPGLAVTGIREMRKGLMESGAGATCMIAVDNLQKLASKNDLLQSVAELKELAESLGIVVIGVADNVELVHERSADMAVKFTEEDGVAVLEVHTTGATEPTRLKLDYRAEIHRFEERL